MLLLWRTLVCSVFVRLFPHVLWKLPLLFSSLRYLSFIIFSFFSPSAFNVFPVFVSFVEIRVKTGEANVHVETGLLSQQ